MLVLHKNKTKIRKNRKVCGFLLNVGINKDLINKLGPLLGAKLKTNYYLRGKLEFLCLIKTTIQE